jgi:hypothetical protein
MAPGAESGKEVYSMGHSEQPAPDPKRILGMKRKLCLLLAALLALILVLALALGLGLGLGLHKKQSSPAPSPASSPPKPTFTGNPDLYIGGAIDPAYYSTKGAFNGSGIALAGESWADGRHGVVNVYFQHWTGTIRWMQLTTEGNWIGGSQSEIVAADAKNSTPISLVAYAINATEKVRSYLYF